jgi:hypothetical protein
MMRSLSRKKAVIDLRGQTAKVQTEKKTKTEAKLRLGSPSGIDEASMN